jgi:hypothetical protein
MSMRKTGIACMAVAAIALSSCGGSSSGSGGSGPQTYSVGGTLSGVQYANGPGATGPELILFDNGGNSIQHPANGKFTFSRKLAAGASYDAVAPSGGYLYAAFHPDVARRRRRRSRGTHLLRDRARDIDGQRRDPTDVRGLQLAGVLSEKRPDHRCGRRPERPVSLP